MRVNARAIVIGGGLIGVTTAYELQSRGLSTTLVEARSGVGLETSYANGGMLTPSMADPWNAPGAFGQLIRSIADPKAPVKVRLSSFPASLGWGLKFLRNANAQHYEYATCANFHLAKYSLERTRAIFEDLNLDYCAADLGTMKVFRSAAAMVGPVAHAKRLAPLGLRYQLLDAEDALRLEPALRPVGDSIAGALYFPEDGAGDAHLFCNALLSAFEELGGKTCLNEPVSGFIEDGDKVRGIRVEKGRLEADVVVVAAGPWSTKLARYVGVRLPIQPVKGYSLTFRLPPATGPAIPIVDDALHAAIVPIGDRLRVAGTAEIAGEDRYLNPVRIENLFELLKLVYPDIARQLDPTQGIGWTGLRPMSADGLPFVGATGPTGLYVNAGHGHLGWTCAMGSAALVVDRIMGEASAIDFQPYDALRKSSSAARAATVGPLLALGGRHGA
jgi:D-amino-acid dehydrogenase